MAAAELIGLGLSNETDSVPPAEELQFRRAEPIAGGPSAAPAVETKTCLICGQAIASEYYQAQGQVTCPVCAERIRSGQQSPPSSSMLRAALLGGGAAFGGSVLYSTVAIVTGLEIGLIAILVGYMVGKAIRRASKGLGGRPQQVLAVLLTYIAISMSYVPVFIYDAAKSKAEPVQTVDTQRSNQLVEARQVQEGPNVSPGKALLLLFGLGLAAPFLILFSNPGSGLLSLLIIFIGLRQAWTLTARPEVIITGPYQPAES